MSRSFNCVLVITATFLYIQVGDGDCSKSKEKFSDDDLVVQLANPLSKIRGHILKSAKDKEYFAFQQIPYAAPPIGQLRFKGPQKHEGWEGILNTTENTIVCPQIVSTQLSQDEDCLFINVYSPVKPSNSNNLAVYVWIHGGAFYFWDSSIYRYGPKYFMDYDVVVVTFEFRHGPLGFLTTEDGVIPAHLGLRDQTSALTWVQDNIHVFGGDPKKVTIGGESTGSMSVGMHLLSPLSKGLFRGAIQQSGSILSTATYQPKHDYYAYSLGKLLDNSLEYGDTTKLLHILQNATVSEILEAQRMVPYEEETIAVISDLLWATTIETSVKEEAEAFLYKPMYDSFLNGEWNKVPILAGFSTLEILWFTPDKRSVGPMVVEWDEIFKTMKRLDEDPSSLINNKLNIPDCNKKLAGTLIKKLYTNSTFENNTEAYFEFSSDSYFTYPMVRQAELTSRYVNTYLYEFAYTPLAENKAIGAEHTEELQYLWHNIEDIAFVNEFQTDLRHTMLKLWTNFIKYQNPTPDSDVYFNKTKWPTVNPQNITCLNINETLNIEIISNRYIQFRDILIKFMEPPLNVF